ncbi:MAG: PaaI family thioesterase [Pseudomonadota bacterium]
MTDGSKAAFSDTGETGEAGERRDGEPPQGYERVPEGIGFGDRLQPLYRLLANGTVSFGFFVANQHLNMMGICHGGALMTLADIAAAGSLYHARNSSSPAPTINLSFDFLNPARRGRWICSRADLVEPKGRFGFCSGVLLDGDQTVLRYSGVYYHGKAASEEEKGVDEAAVERTQRLERLMGKSG